jgi:hypothetical protein
MLRWASRLYVISSIAQGRWCWLLIYIDSQNSWIPVTASHSLTFSPLLIWRGVVDLEFIYFSWPLYCLSCDLRLLINHLVSSNFPKNTCIIVTNPDFPSLSLFFFTELCPATLQKFSFFTQPLRGLPSTYKCTMSSPPLIQVQSIRYMVLVFNGSFNIFFNYIVAVSFIGGGNQSTRRKPPIYCKSLTNCIS